MTQCVTATRGLNLRDVTVVADETVLLQRVSLQARPGTLTAVIGPSGAGKSTLAKVIAGAVRPATGTVALHARDVRDSRDDIGMVPQDDVVHGRLTVAQALQFAAELRMAAGTGAGDRAWAIAAVLEELELTSHAATRIESLSGGQRKRVSVAIELLTEPSLLVLDEPTTGLDPALDRSVMAMLRRLADAGRVVVVVTHSLSFLDVCDQVLMLAPGGKTVFVGAPEQINSVLGGADWADIFATVCADADSLHRRFLQRRARQEAETLCLAVAAPAVSDRLRPGLWRQTSTLVRRQVRLLLANRGYLAFLAVLPFLVGLLPLTVAGDSGLGALPAPGAPPLEAKHVIALTSFAAILMGATLTVRDLVGERAVYRREQAAGLSATAYLMAKALVFGAVAALQSAVLVAIVIAPGVGKPGPSSAVVLGSATVELLVGVAATSVVAVLMGLAISAMARTGDQVIVLLAVALMAQLVLAGGFIPVTGRPVMEALAWITPGRWGFAATASTADVTRLVAGIADDVHWQHTASAWLVNMAMLGVLGVLFAGAARWRLRARR